MFAAVIEHIVSHVDDYIDMLRRLCRQPSVSSHGIGLVDTASLVAEMLSEIGAEVRMIETSGNPVVYAELTGASAKTLAFYDHYDVQPPDPLESWDSGPFEAEVRDDKLYARGASDNKGNLVARIAAVSSYLQTLGELPLSVKFVVEGEEEIGSPHLKEFVDANPDLAEADGYIWEIGHKDFKGRPQIYLGVNGFLYIELLARCAIRDLHASWGAVVPNPLWRLCWALSSLKSRDERIAIPEFYGRAQPVSRIESELLDEIDFADELWLERFGLTRFLMNLSGRQVAERLMFEPRCTICGIQGGYTGPGPKSVLPSAARAKLHFGLVANQEPQEILAQLKRHLVAEGFEDMEVVPLYQEHAARTDPGDPLVRAVVAAARSAYGVRPQVYPTAPGGGPMYSLCQERGIPAVSTGVGYWGSNVHAPNENIRLVDFAEGMKHIAWILHEYTKTS